MVAWWNGSQRWDVHDWFTKRGSSSASRATLIRLAVTGELLHLVSLGVIVEWQVIGIFFSDEGVVLRNNALHRADVVLQRRLSKRKQCIPLPDDVPLSPFASSLPQRRGLLPNSTVQRPRPSANFSPLCNHPCETAAAMSG